MKHKKQNLYHKLNRTWQIKQTPQKDNNARRYDECDRKWCKPLEDKLKAAIEKERDEWRKPYSVYEDKNGIQKDYEPRQTIRERLALDDAGFRYSAWKYHFSNWCTRVRVPSLKRNNTEWENFYRTFPTIAIMVALGTERFCDGAKLKYIPLFKKILDEVWPEDLTRWTEVQYEDLLMKGKINNIIS